MYNVKDVAQYVINYSSDSEHPVSNLKLQKLLYYIQAAFLVEKGEPCFEEIIQHWRHGPVVPSIYSEYKTYLDGNIPRQDSYFDVYLNKDMNIIARNVDYDSSIYSEDDKILMNEVIESYFDVSPWDMVNKTHQEAPWLNTEANDEITKESIIDYFFNNEERIYGNM